jgi:hypothetical protein
MGTEVPISDFKPNDPWFVSRPSCPDRNRLAMASLVADRCADLSSRSCRYRIARRVTGSKPRPPDSSREIRHRRRSTATLADWQFVHAVNLPAHRDSVNLKTLGRRHLDRIDAPLAHPASAGCCQFDPVHFGRLADPDFFRAVNCFVAAARSLVVAASASLCVAPYELDVRPKALDLLSRPSSCRKRHAHPPEKRCRKAIVEFHKAGTPLAVRIAPTVESAATNT